MLWKWPLLEQHPAISKVNYTGLASHLIITTAKQMRHAGAMLSFEMNNGLEAQQKIHEQITDVHPCRITGHLRYINVTRSRSMTHHGVPKEKENNTASPTD